MRAPALAASFAVVAALVAVAGCSQPTPAQLVEKTVRALYAGPLGDRDKERDALRLQASERWKQSSLALDASCNEILANDAPNHGLAGSAVDDFNRNCLDGKPLSCGGSGGLGLVEVGDVKGDTASAVVHVGNAAADVTLKVIDGKFVVDDVLCRH